MLLINLTKETHRITEGKKSVLIPLSSFNHLGAILFNMKIQYVSPLPTGLNFFFC